MQSNNYVDIATYALHTLKRHASWDEDVAEISPALRQYLNIKIGLMTKPVEVYDFFDNLRDRGINFKVPPHPVQVYEYSKTLYSRKAQRIAYSIMVFSKLLGGIFKDDLIREGFSRNTKEFKNPINNYSGPLHFQGMRALVPVSDAEGLIRDIYANLDDANGR